MKPGEKNPSRIITLEGTSETDPCANGLLGLDNVDCLDLIEKLEGEGDRDISLEEAHLILDGFYSWFGSGVDPPADFEKVFMDLRETLRQMEAITAGQIGELARRLVTSIADREAVEDLAQEARQLTEGDNPESIDRNSPEYRAGAKHVMDAIAHTALNQLQP